MFLILTTVSFWFEDRIGVHPPVWNVIAFGRYPLSIYSGAVQFFLCWIIPFGLASFYPSVRMLGRTVSPEYAPLVPVVAVVLLHVWRFPVESRHAPLLFDRLLAGTGGSRIALVLDDQNGDVVGLRSAFGERFDAVADRVRPFPPRFGPGIPRRCAAAGALRTFRLASVHGLGDAVGVDHQEFAGLERQRERSDIRASGNIPTGKFSDASASSAPERAGGSAAGRARHLRIQIRPFR